MTNTEENQPKKPTEKDLDLIKEFKKEPKSEQTLLIIAGIVFISTLLPWAGALGYNVNGWHGFGLLSVAASILYLAQWLLPKFKVKIPKIDHHQKILILAMLAGPILFLVQTSFRLIQYAGIGFWATLIASGYGTYLLFAPKKK